MILPSRLLPTLSSSLLAAIVLSSSCSSIGSSPTPITLGPRPETGSEQPAISTGVIGLAEPIANSYAADIRIDLQAIAGLPDQIQVGDAMFLRIGQTLRSRWVSYGVELDFPLVQLQGIQQIEGAQDTVADVIYLNSPGHDQVSLIFENTPGTHDDFGQVSARDLAIVLAVIQGNTTASDIADRANELLGAPGLIVAANLNPVPDLAVEADFVNKGSAGVSTIDLAAILASIQVGADLGSLVARMNELLGLSGAESVIEDDIVTIPGTGIPQTVNTAVVTSATPSINASDQRCSLAEAISNINNNNQFSANPGECPTGSAFGGTIRFSFPDSTGQATIDFSGATDIPPISSIITLDGSSADGTAAVEILGDPVFNLNNGQLTLNGTILNATSLTVTGTPGGGPETFSLNGSGHTLNSTSTALNLTDVTINGDQGSSTNSAALDTVISSGGTSGILLNNTAGRLIIGNTGSNLSGHSGASFAINGGSVAVEYAGDISQGNSAPAVAVEGGHSNLASEFVAFSGSVTATNGTGLQFNNADGDYRFTGTATLNGGDAGIDIIGGSQGSFSFSNAPITDPSGVAFNVNGSNVTSISHTGIISQTNAVNAVAINTMGSGTATFNSAITAATTTATGINLANNSGGTINFNGGLDIDTTSGIGFNATNGGTITVTGTGNTITTTDDTALSFTNTTIGSVGSGPPTTYGLTFQRISASNATNCVLVSNAGSGGFQITGTGSTGGSGGTCQSISQNGLDFTSTNNIDINNINLTGVASSDSGTSGNVLSTLNSIAGNYAGVKLNTVDTIILNNVTIDGTETGAGVNNNNGEVGISGIGVSNLTMTDVTVEEFGNQGNEHNVEFQNLTGTVTITDFISRDTGGGLFLLKNFSGSNSLNMTITRGDFEETVNGVGRGGLEMETASANAFNVIVDDSDFGNGIAALSDGGLQGTGLSLDVDNGATGSLTVRNNSTFDGMNVGISGTLDVGSGNLTTSISNTSITGIRATGINFFLNGSATGTLQGTIQDSTIGTFGTTASGSDLGSGISARNEGTGTMTLLIDNNTVQEVDDFEGIFITANVNTNTVNATVTNNLIREIDFDRGLVINDNSGANGTICADVQGNTFTNTGGSTDLRLRQDTDTYNVVQTSQANLNSVNNSATSTITGTVNFGAVASCPTP